MKIFIFYNNIKKELITKDFQSIHSIINQYLDENDINDNPNDFYIDYNGKYLNRLLCLEKYNIMNEYTISLNHSNKGGSGFFSLLVKNPILVIIVFIIAFIPILLLPIGLLPTISNFLKVIMDKSIIQIGKYLVCTLGKKTLFKRIKTIFFLLKYVFLFMMVYIMITFPLVLLCITLKGRSIFENPKNLCKPMQSGKTAGLIITMIYLFIYLIMRAGPLLINPFINLFKKFYITNTLIVPILNIILSIFNYIKFIPFLFMPFIGPINSTFYNLIEKVVPLFEMLLQHISKVGCGNFSTKEFTKMLKNVKNMSNQFTEVNDPCKCKKDDNIDKEQQKIKDEEQIIKNEKRMEEERMINQMKAIYDPDLSEFCNEEDNEKCCDKSKYLFLADTLSTLLDNNIVAQNLKKYDVYQALGLIIEAFYDSCMGSENNQAIISKTLDEKKNYINKIKTDKFTLLPKELKDEIDEFLKNSQENKFYILLKKLNVKINIPSKEYLQEINSKKKNISEKMLKYANETNTPYTETDTLQKKVIKILLVDIFCNIITTSKSSEGVIEQMGHITEIIDMLKCGSAAGVICSIIYILTLLVLIIMGIFGFL